MKKYLLIPLAIVLVSALIFGGCKPAPKGPEEILVGSPASLTGMFAGFGVGQIFGAQAAVDDINAQGGVYVEEYGHKLPIKLVVVNDESDPLKVAALAEDLVVREKVHVLVSGNNPPPMHLGVANIAQRYKIPHLARPAVMEPWLGMRAEITPPWEYTWATGFSIVAGAPEGDFRYQVPGYTDLDTWVAVLDGVLDQTNKRVGVFATDEPDGRAWYALFSSPLQEIGLTISGIDKELGLFPIGNTDFTPIIREWMADDVDILWGNCPAPDFGTLWRQAHALGFQPKVVFVGRAPCNYVDIIAWGGNLPHGVCVEMQWNPAYDSHGIGDTTPQSLTARWTEATGDPVNFNIGLGYYLIQVLIDAIERAGTLDAEALNKAIGETDLMTMNWRVKFDENQWSVDALSFGQWHKVDAPHQWEMKIVASQHEFIKPDADFIFPVPYD